MARQSRTRLALWILGGVWLWGFTNFGGVAFGHRCHLFALATLAAIWISWPSRSSTYRLTSWHLGVGLLLNSGVAFAPVAQLPGWMLAALVWSTWVVVGNALTEEPRLASLLPRILLAVALWQAGLGIWQGLNSELVRGTLRNPNHFAGSMAIGLGLASALTWQAWRQRLTPQTPTPQTPTPGFRHIAWLLGSLACGLLLWATMLSGSRGGLAVALGVLFFVYLRVRLRHWQLPTGQLDGRPRQLQWVALIGVWWLTVVAVTTWVMPRLDVDGLERRLLIYQSSIEMILDHPLQGVGPGLYRWALRPYQRFDTAKFFDHAHNDYIELAAEWGLPLALLVLFFVGRSWQRANAAVKGGEVNEGSTLALGVSVALLAPLAHAWIDFDLQIPVLLMQFVVLLVVANSFEVRLPKARPEGWRWRCRVVSSLMVVVLGILAIGRVETLAWAYGQARGSDRPSVIEDALKLAPKSPNLHFQLGMVRRDADAHRQPRAARYHLLEAVRLNPLSWRYRFELGRFYELMGRPSEALDAYLQALRLNPWDSDYQRRIGAFLLRLGAQPSKTPGTGASSQGRALLARAVVEDPRQLRQTGELLLSASHSPEDVVAWWPRDLAFRDPLLRLLCDRFAVHPEEAARGDGPLAELWRQWLDGGEPITIEQGDFYLRYLLQRQRETEARQQWIRLAQLDPQMADSALEVFESHGEVIWNGDFETPLHDGILSWRIPGPWRIPGSWRAPGSWRVPGGRQHVARRVLDEGIDGSTALSIDFDATANLDFKRLRQHLIVDPSAVYELEYYLRSDQLTPTSGLFLQVIEEVSRRRLFEGEAVSGTTAWQHGSGRVRVPAGVRRLVVRLAAGSAQDRMNPVGGRLWLDRVSMRRVVGPHGEGAQ